MLCHRLVPASGVDYIVRRMWMLYQLAMAVALAVAAPVFLLRRGRHYLATLPGRLGRFEAAGGARKERGGALWIHAVSVGEVGVAATLVRALPETLPLLVTTVTPTGQSRARALLGQRATVTYLPFDLGFAVERFFRRFSPAALVLVEGDYWPLVLRAAARRSLPVVVVNGRVSDRTFPRLYRLRRLLGPLFGPVARFGVQTEQDHRRLLALGLTEERVVVTSNLKFETAEPKAMPELETEIRRLAAGRPVLVAGSTMEGEEATLLDAFTTLGGGERALLVLAPRHPERWEKVARLLAESGLAHARRTVAGSGELPAVLLLDSLGELAALYRLAAAAFVGGTLVRTGGHNPLEPARFGVPTAVGPSMANFQEIADQFDTDEAWRRVAGAAELAVVWQEWLDDPATARAVGLRGAALVAANRGALERTLALLEPLVATVVERAS